MAKKSYEIDMCDGPLLGKILLFAIPLMLSSILQLLFNAADMIVAGRYAGSASLAAIGSTSALINLLINIFIGLSVGANVQVARFYGAKREKDVSETVHTAVLLSLISGIIMAVIGFFAARPLLLLMGTPEDVLPLSVSYMKIIFIGMPAMLAYNFGSSILRAIGDTRRPLYFLLTAGIINVILNLFFIIQLHMGVAGVATATSISQAVSAVLVLNCLRENKGMCHLDLHKLRIHKDKLIHIATVGLPAGFQGALFSASNVLIQSSVNSFGSIAMAGNTASGNLEGFIYNAMNALYQTSLSFTSQNYGAKKYDRIKRILLLCQACVVTVGVVMGFSAVFFGKQLLGIYSSDPEVISYGILRLSIICTTYFICGMMDTMVGSLRGIGYSVMPMIVSLLGACVFRIIWIFTIFQVNHTLSTLYISYPVSWSITFAVHLICFVVVYRKLSHKSQPNFD